MLTMLAEEGGGGGQKHTQPYNKSQINKRREETKTTQALSSGWFMWFYYIKHSFPWAGSAPKQPLLAALMCLAAGQERLPALLIARLKSLHLIGPVIHEGIIQRASLSKTQIGPFEYRKGEEKEKKQELCDKWAPESLFCARNKSILLLPRMITVKKKLTWGNSWGFL